MLHQRVGEIFLANEPAEAREAFSDSLERFLVKDIGTERDELSVVLLAESPHTDEVRLPAIHDRYPLAGSTGRHVRDKLAEWIPTLTLRKKPIGQLVHEPCNAVSKLGIMNVSQLPFEKRPYVDHDNGICQNQCWNDYIRCMKYIKKHPSIKTYKNNNNRQTLRCKIDRLEHAIIKDLAERLASIGKNVQVMCLGEVAQIFYLKSFYYYNTNRYVLDFPYTNRYILDFPHPSRTHWNNLAPQNDPRLQGILDHIQPPQAT